MKRSNRLVIPLVDEHGVEYRSLACGGHQYQADVNERLEISVEEAQAIIINLPMICEFIIQERLAMCVKGEME